jgi:hypothetical protein
MKATRLETLAGIGCFAAVAFLATTARAQVNSWSSSSGGKWETAGNWSLGVAPSIAQSAIMITNGGVSTFKVITIDAVTASQPTTMSIGNLTVGQPSPIRRNVLSLNNAGSMTPLEISNSLTISNSATLTLTNSVLRVDGVFSDDGIVNLIDGMIVGTNGTTIVGNTGIGQMTVANGTWLASDAFVGYRPGSQGILSIAGGTNLISFILDLAFNAGSTGTVWMSGGQLIVTNSGNGIGIGDNGVGQMTISNGTCQTPSIYVAYTSTSRGTLTVAGGTGIVGRDGVIVATASGATGSVWVTGGQLEVTDSAIAIGSGGVGQMTVSNGTLLATDIDLGQFSGSQGTLTVAGGSSSVFSNLTIGNVDHTATGAVSVVGGGLYVTNTTSTAVLEVDSGTLTVAGGTLVANKLVAKNSGANIAFPAGTMTLGGAEVTNGHTFQVGAGSQTAVLNLVGGLSEFGDFHVGYLNTTDIVWVTGGQLSVGGQGVIYAPSQMIVSNGTVNFRASVFVRDPGAGLTIAGGTVDTHRFTFGATGLVTVEGGALWVTGGQFLSADSVTFIGWGGDNLYGPGQMTFSNGTWYALAVAVGGITPLGYSHGILTFAGGTSTVSFGLTIGDPNCGGTGIVNVVGGELDVTNSTGTAKLEIDSGTLTQTGGVVVVDQLVVTNACAHFVQTGGMLITTGSAQVDQGTQVLSGVVVISSNLVVGSTAGVTGTVTVAGGSLMVSDGVIGIGNNGTTTGAGGVGLMDISNSVVTASSVLLGSSGGGQGSLAVRVGGDLNIDCKTADCKLASNDVLLDGGTIDAADAILSIGENHVSTVTISNGVATFLTAYVGFNNTGTLTMPGGAMTVLSNMVVGDCGASVTGVVVMSGGSLYVTNATGTAVLEIRDRSVTLSAGLLKVDRFVMTNACTSFVHTGGALIYGSTVLDPNRDDDGDGIPNGYDPYPLDSSNASADSDGDGLTDLQEYLAGTNPTNAASSFHVLSIMPTNDDVLIVWQTADGHTNVVQAASDLSGSYSTISPNIVVTGNGDTTTNYLDVGAATNTTPRYYRVRLVP